MILEENFEVTFFHIDSSSHSYLFCWGDLAWHFFSGGYFLFFQVGSYFCFFHETIAICREGKSNSSIGHECKP